MSTKTPDPKSSICFNPCYNGKGIIALLQGNSMMPVPGFNPCYNGKGIIAPMSASPKRSPKRFNPCYNGKGIIAAIIEAKGLEWLEFQSLL